MFTLALGLATLMVLENLLQRSLVLGFLWTLGMAGLASWLGVDYEWRGIIVIVIFYLFHSQINNNNIHIIYNISVFIICFILMAHYGIIGTILACTITALYNQSRGFINKNKFKYMFYGFYPIHIIIIFLCQ